MCGISAVMNLWVFAFRGFDFDHLFISWLLLICGVFHYLSIVSRRRMEIQGRLIDDQAALIARMLTTWVPGPGAQPHPRRSEK